ncbi:MAG: hypothetical protein ACI4TX_04735 [Christensenellales bacterium]
MSNNPNVPNRRPPLRPKPNIPRTQPKSVPPRPPYRPRPNPQATNQNNAGPTAQEMFASLSQAYNNMVNNLQFMNAVGIVNGIYQNANNFNKYPNAFAMQNELMEQYKNYSANQQQNGNNNFYQDLNNEKEKQAFFDEFYSYLTNRMAQDNLTLKNTKEQAQEKEAQVEVVNEQKEKRLAMLQAQKENLNIVDYLNKVCDETEYGQFSPVDLQTIVLPSPVCNVTLSSCNNSPKGEFIEAKEYDINELKDTLDKYTKGNEEGDGQFASLGEDKVEQVDLLMDEEQNAKESEQLNEEMLKLEKELKELEQQLSEEEFSQTESEYDENDVVEDNLLVNADEGVQTETDDIGEQDEIVDDKDFESLFLDDDNSEDVATDEENEFLVDEEPEEVEFDDEELDESTTENDKQEEQENHFFDGENESQNNSSDMNNEQGIDENNLVVNTEFSSDEEGEEETEEFEDEEDDGEEEDYSDILVYENGEGLINHSMKSKVLNADDDVKVIYNDIKNYLLSYKGIKARYSSACESFRLSRKLMAKFVIIGRTVKLYLALNPESLPNNIYHQKDESKKKAYIDVPFMVKIKSNLSIRKAKELIDKMMQENDISKNFKYVEKDYIEELKIKQDEE